MALAACSRAEAPIDLRTIPNQNVLLITIDTLRADALGSYGGRAATPALDRLAADGVRFDFAHAHAVVTLPSHASILTGQYPFQHGLRDNSGYRLAASVPTLATMLKEAGYATAAFVAAFPLNSRFGLTRGFDVYDDRFGESSAPSEFAMPERPASAVVPLARQWIAERPGGSGGAGRAGGAGTPGGSGRSGGPWFVWVHVFDPHAPYRPPPPFDTQYADRPYDGEVAATDAALAPLLDDVRRAGQPTMVVVTGDHGEALGDHGEQAHGLFAYESTLRVPLILAELGTVRLKADTTKAAPASSSVVVSGFSRTVVTTPAQHVDILPTILEAVGRPVPSGLPGRSLLTAAERRDASTRPSYFEAMSGMLNRGAAPLSGVLVDRDKFIELPIPERYDLAADPGERVNLAGRSPEQDRTLATLVARFNASPPGARAPESAAAAAQLRSLGYVSGNAPVKGAYTPSDDPKALVAIDADIHRAVEAFGAGRADEAIAIYRRVIAARPDFPLAYRHLAFIERQRGQIAAAVDVLEQAMRAGIRQPALVTDLGACLTDAGRIPQAIAVLEPIAGSGDADTLNTLGIAYAQAGRKADAERTFERVLAIDPESSIPLENLGMLALERGDVTAARERFARAVAVQPRSSRAYAGLGLVALWSGDRKGAVDAWTRAVALDARNFDALFNLGTTLARGGDAAAARPYLDAFLRTAPPPYERDKREVERLLRR